MSHTQTQAPTITFKLNDDKHELRNITTNDSIFEDEEEFGEESEDEREIAQDWSKSVDPKETWAYKERRRNSVFGVHDEYDITSTSPTRVKVMEGRRGSILSVWRSGKDAKGRDILVHDDAELEGDKKDLDADEVLVLEKTITNYSTGKRSERRGSILSMWTPGVDEKGRAVINHDDEEWQK